MILIVLVMLAIVAVVLYMCIAKPGISGGTISSTSPSSPSSLTGLTADIDRSPLIRPRSTSSTFITPPPIPNLDLSEPQPPTIQPPTVQPPTTQTTIVVKSNDIVVPIVESVSVPPAENKYDSKLDNKPPIIVELKNIEPIINSNSVIGTNSNVNVIDIEDGNESLSDDTESISSSTSTSSSVSSSNDMTECHNAALEQLQICQDAAGKDIVASDKCWGQIYSQLKMCVPTSSNSSSSSSSSSPIVAPVRSNSGVGLVFNDGTLIKDRLDLAIEVYLGSMDKEDSERQTCVEQLLNDINKSTLPLTSAQQTAFLTAQSDLQDCFQQSSSIQHDFLCLRKFYINAIDTLHLPLIQLAQEQKRSYATNRAIATNCYQQATATLKQCMESIKTIQDPLQRETSKQLSIKEYKDLLNSCLCLSYGNDSCNK